jgi:3-hydroxyacyl-CoA dehydrogenase/enoyl-CoA hydratase/3-hydroxybutyryl-CoA epimerase
LTAGLKRVDDLFQKAVERKRLSAEEAKQRRSAVRGTVAWEGFDRVDLVIEAAVEDLEIKRNLFRDLTQRVGPTTVLATNTSSLAIARVQEGLPHPERIGGLHFFNPVHKMPLVEVVRSPGLSPSALGLLTRFAIDLGKTPVIVGDGPGFVVNRILMPYLDESVRLLGEGLSIKDIDLVMKRFGMPLGPLGLLDQIGLDVAAHVDRLVQQQLGQSVLPNSLFEQMKQQGWLGEKSGRGFYVHGKKSHKPHSAAQEMGRKAGAPEGATSTLPASARLADARERMVLVMVNEAARALEVGLADNAETIDLAMVFGTGWAPHRGGPLKYADDRGLAEVVQALTALAARLGPRFEPCGELKRRAGSGERFRPVS